MTFSGFGCVGNIMVIIFVISSKRKSVRQGMHNLPASVIALLFADALQLVQKFPHIYFFHLYSGSGYVSPSFWQTEFHICCICWLFQQNFWRILSDTISVAVNDKYVQILFYGLRVHCGCFLASSVVTTQQLPWLTQYTPLCQFDTI